MSYGKNSDSVKQAVQSVGQISLTQFSKLLVELKSENQHEQAKALFTFRCASDLELFAATYFPHFCKYSFNEFHDDSFQTMDFMEVGIRRARAAPRGYAKSTLKALIKPIHDVCYGLEKFIVIISSTQDQANQKLRDIRSEVLTNADLINDYGIHFRTRNPGETQYTVWCGAHVCMFKSYGSGVEIRGIRFGADRPTKVIVDDGEDSEEVLNEALRKKQEDWFFQVVSQIGSNDTNIEVIGTILHSDSLLAKLLKNPAYNSKLFKSVISWSERQDLWDKWTQIYTNLENENRVENSDQFYEQNKAQMLKGTKVLWEEKEPYIFLMKELVEKGRRAFMKEKQNEPIGGDEALFEQFHFYRETSEGILIESNQTLYPWSNFRKRDESRNVDLWLNSYGALDPAAGQTKAKPGKLGDFACLLTGLKDPRGRLLVHRDWTKRASPTKQIEEVFEYHSEFEFQKFGVETNLYRNLLLPNMVAERKKRETETKRVIRLPFYDIENIESKDKRIYTLEPKVSHGWILFNRALSTECMNQFYAYPHVDHDDAPDCLHMLWNLMNNRYKAGGIGLDAMGGR